MWAAATPWRSAAVSAARALRGVAARGVRLGRPRADREPNASDGTAEGPSRPRFDVPRRALAARAGKRALSLLTVSDKGRGIPDVQQAMEPLFTTGGEERAGLGFAVMQSFCDKVSVRSTPGKGTAVTLQKNLLRRGRSHD